MSKIVSLDGSVAVVTGGAVGIGAVYVEGMARAGASVLATDIDDEAAVALAKRLQADGLQVESMRMDVTDPAQIDEAFRFADKRFGGVDILVNNAALFTTLLPMRPFTEIESEEWARVMKVNVEAPFLCAKAALPYLRRSGRGRIINISSTTALTGAPTMLHYITSKGAVIALTRALAREVGGDAITVNSIAPGLTSSPTALSTVDAERFDAAAATRALKRHQQPEDLVGTLLFLASEASAFVTGQTHVVDGGAFLQ
jgi:NAD(P)-dependent dehydrogenase (short-subunit alcohol dehydrogenase family)